jgi:hypothetical protein
MPVVAMPAVTSANRNVMIIVFLMGLISLLLLLQTWSCMSNFVPSEVSLSLAVGFAGEPGRGERLKMIRTGDSPPNNTYEIALF